MPAFRWSLALLTTVAMVSMSASAQDVGQVVGAVDPKVKSLARSKAQLGEADIVALLGVTWPPPETRASREDVEAAVAALLKDRTEELDESALAKEAEEQYKLWAVGDDVAFTLSSGRAQDVKGRLTAISGNSVKVGSRTIRRDDMPEEAQAHLFQDTNAQMREKYVARKLRLHKAGTSKTVAASAADIGEVYVKHGYAKIEGEWFSGEQTTKLVQGLLQLATKYRKYLDDGYVEYKGRWVPGDEYRERTRWKPVGREMYVRNNARVYDMQKGAYITIPVQPVTVVSENEDGRQVIFGTTLARKYGNSDLEVRGGPRAGVMAKEQFVDRERFILQCVPVWLEHENEWRKKERISEKAVGLELSGSDIMGVEKSSGGLQQTLNKYYHVISSGSVCVSIGYVQGGFGPPGSEEQGRESDARRGPHSVDANGNASPVVPMRDVPLPVR